MGIVIAWAFMGVAYFGLWLRLFRYPRGSKQMGIMYAIVVIVGAWIALGQLGGVPAKDPDGGGAYVMMAAVIIPILVLVAKVEELVRLAKPRRPNPPAVAKASAPGVGDIVPASNRRGPASPQVVIGVGYQKVSIAGLALHADTKYRSLKGLVTERHITVHGADGVQLIGGPIRVETLSCYCHARRAARTFRIDRMEWLADHATGEIITDMPGWLGMV